MDNMDGSNFQALRWNLNWLQHALPGKSPTSACGWFAPLLFGLSTDRLLNE